MSKGCRSSFQQGEFGIVPAFHGDDIPYYFPGNSMYLNPRAVSILASHQSAIVDRTPPQWPQWMEEDAVEMLFDRTEMGVPILELKKTCDGLQNRCE